jgi:hypothetical protein
MSFSIGPTPLFSQPITNSPTPPAVTPSQEGVGNSWLNQFFNSALRSATSEQVGLPGQWTENVTGITPQQGDAWRTQNWGASLTSQLLGGALPYLLPIAAAPAVAARVGGGLGRLFSTEALLARPVATTAGRALVETAAIDIPRVVVSPFLGGDAESVLESAGLNTAASVLLGGGFGFVRSLRAGRLAEDTDRALAARVPDYNPTNTPQERLAALRVALPQAADADIRTLMERNIGALEQTVRYQAGRPKDIGPLEGIDEIVTQRDIGRLFGPAKTSDSEVIRQYVRSPTQGFGTTEAWENAIREVGLPENWQTMTQYPREITALSEAQAGRIRANVSAHLTDVGNGWFVKREANQDLFVVARQLPSTQGNFGRWFVARTNQPEAFIPNSPIMRRGEKLARFIGEAEDGAYAKAAQALPEGFIAREDFIRRQEWKPYFRMEKAKWDAMEMLPQGVKNLGQEAKTFAQPSIDKLRGVVAPAMAQFTNQPLASWAYQVSRSTFDSAAGKARRILNGELGDGISPLRAVGKGLQPEAGLRGLFSKLTQEDMEIVLGRWAPDVRKGTAWEEALTTATRDLPPANRAAIEDFVRAYREAGTNALNEQIATAKLTGNRAAEFDDSFEFPHVWKGEHRAVVVDERGKTVHRSGGNSRAEAVADANAYVAAHPGTRVSRVHVADTEDDLLVTAELNRQRRASFKESFDATAPGNLKARMSGDEVTGYIGSSKSQMPTREEFWKVLSYDLETKYKNIASQIVDNQIYQRYGVEILKRYGLEVHNQWVKRLNDMVGRPTSWTRAQNKIVDTALAGSLGKNSASKIVTAYNGAEAHLQLFFGNIGYVAAQAATFFQTVAPKLALTRQMLARGEVDRAFGMYDFTPLITKDGIRGATASLSPLKLAMQGMKMLRNPSNEERQMFLRAARENVVVPKMYGDFVGENSRVRSAFKEAMAGNEPISNLIKGAGGLNAAIPLKVEELTRAHTFMVGLRMAESLGAQGEARYQLAKNFTWRTMYGFSQADRPRVFTGPAGMALGLFKNWMFHYLADFGMYSREALRGNYQGLLWATAGVGVMAGLGGLPLYTVADQFQKLFTNKPMVENLYGGLGVEAGDALFYGLPGMLGVSLQGSTGAPLNDPIRDVTFMFNLAVLDRAKRIGQMGGEAWNQWASGGSNPLQSDRTWDMMTYALGPRTLYKAMAQVEDGALKSIRNGRPIMDGISDNEWLLNTVGLTPTRIARAWETSETLWSDQERRRARTSAFGTAFSEAWTRNDNRAMGEVLARAIEANADISSVMQSAVTQQRNLQQPQMPFDYIRVPGAIDRMQTMGVWQ